MSFMDKIKKTREELGISQECLAEKLNISRQAITKWENGNAMPDIDNLIEISNIFQVSLDYLLKDSTCTYVANIMNCDNSELINFIVEAKKNTYANYSAGNVESSRLASVDLAYESGDYKYLDTYVTGANFSGSEVVYHKNIPIWSMNYMGQLLSDKGNQSSDFLKKALSLVDFEMPYRGPKFLQDGKYVYINSVDGDFNWFHGFENIYYKDEHIYELVYHGGNIN